MHLILSPFQGVTMTIRGVERVVKAGVLFALADFALVGSKLALAYAGEYPGGCFGCLSTPLELE